MEEDDIKRKDFIRKWSTVLKTIYFEEETIMTKHLTLIIGVIIGTFFLGAAAVAVPSANPDFMPLNYNVNGEQIDLKGDQTAINVNGRIYVPLDSMAECLDQPLNWDGKTNTIWVGNTSAQIIARAFMENIKGIK
jgi:hypothetical protein